LILPFLPSFLLYTHLSYPLIHEQQSSSPPPSPASRRICTRW
jgi:hypothetical protein